jgi:hypothetical protein
MILFLFFLSCSQTSHSNPLGFQLQTQAPSRGSPSFFDAGELSLKDPVDLSLLLKILSPFFKNQNKSNFALRAYPNPFHSTSDPIENRVVAGAYWGGIYDPINNQIVFAPFVQANRTTWHRYDCSTHTIQAYENPFHSTSDPEEHRAVAAGAYLGGVFDPINNQIIFAPYAQSTRTSWHRYDCATQTIQAYNNPFDSASSPPENQALNLAYHGGVYDPLNKQILIT